MACSGKRGLDARASLAQPLHRFHRFVEHRPFAPIEIDLDDALHAAGADDDRHADIEIVETVLPLQAAPRRAPRASYP